MSTILIIDDDDRFRGVIKEMLQRAGYSVLEASNGSAGINLYKEKKPDLIITDVIMPEKDGAEVIFELQRINPDIRIIVMTGGGQGDAQTYLDSIKTYSKVKHTFEKPFAMNDLLAAVEDALS